MLLNNTGIQTGPLDIRQEFSKDLKVEQSNDQSMNHCQHFKIQSEFVREKKEKNTQRELGRMKWNCITKTGLADDATMQWMDVSESELTEKTWQNSVAERKGGLEGIKKLTGLVADRSAGPHPRRWGCDDGAKMMRRSRRNWDGIICRGGTAGRG